MLKGTIKQSRGYEILEGCEILGRMNGESLTRRLMFEKKN